jgi:hypothetical protein
MSNELDSYNHMIYIDRCRLCLADVFLCRKVPQSLLSGIASVNSPQPLVSIKNTDPFDRSYKKAQ